MSKFVTVVTDDSVMVLDTSSGESVKFFSGDSRFDSAVALIKHGTPEEVFELDTKRVLASFIESSSFGDITISIEDGAGVITLHNHNDLKVPLQSAITERILKMSSQGFSAEPLVNFIANLYDNPSKTAIDELYLFIEACELPITEDGYFIAYKMVRDDYKDIYSGTMTNFVGDTVSMPRALVDDKRENTCSRGLHFCSKAYLPHYGTGSGTRCLLVKINPADVVSIPSDYNNAKGRTWVYEVVGEVENDWRTTLKTTDYTDSAVVSDKGTEIPTPVTKQYSDAYAEGYEQGWEDHIAGEIWTSPVHKTTPTQDILDYDAGYDRAYKDRTAHRARLIK